MHRKGLYVKRRAEKAAILIVLGLLLVSMTSCDSRSAVAGKYENAHGEETLILAKDGTMRLREESCPEGITFGSYTTGKGNTIEIVNGGTAQKYTYTKSRDTLTLYEEGSNSGEVWTRTGSAPGSAKLNPTKAKTLVGTFHGSFLSPAKNRGIYGGYDYGYVTIAFYKDGSCSIEKDEEKGEGRYTLEKGKLTLILNNNAAQYIVEYDKDELILVIVEEEEHAYFLTKQED